MKNAQLRVALFSLIFGLILLSTTGLWADDSTSNGEEEVFELIEVEDKPFYRSAEWDESLYGGTRYEPNFKVQPEAEFTLYAEPDEDSTALYRIDAGPGELNWQEVELKVSPLELEASEDLTLEGDITIEAGDSFGLYAERYEFASPEPSTVERYYISHGGSTHKISDFPFEDYVDVDIDEHRNERWLDDRSSFWVRLDVRDKSGWVRIDGDDIEAEKLEVGIEAGG